MSVSFTLCMSTNRDVDLKRKHEVGNNVLSIFRHWLRPNESLPRHTEASDENPGIIMNRWTRLDEECGVLETLVQIQSKISFPNCTACNPRAQCRKVIRR